MQNSPFRINVERLEAALVKYQGNVTAVAKSLGFSRRGIVKAIERSPTLTDLMAELLESRLDVAEDGLNKALKKGAPWAIKFVLMTQGKGRGYTLRQDEGGGEGRPTVVKIIRNVIPSRQ